MAIVVEDGTGLTSAESYASVAFADAYHLARGREDTWVDLDEDVKEQHLRDATDFMLQEYRQRWAGYRRTTTQALDWPRELVPLRDVVDNLSRNYYDNNVVPVEVKRACAELAFRAKDAALAPDIAPQVESKEVGPIKVTYAPWSRETTKYRAIDAMLAPLLRGVGSSSATVVRT